MRKTAAIIALAVVGFVVLDATGLIPLRRATREGVPAVRVIVEMLGTALDTFQREVGRYPTTEEGLRALRQRPDGLAAWHGPYLTKDVPTDPWGRSLGADGESGGSGSDTDTVGTSPSVRGPVS
jgi:general secretion pathway protein G